MDKEAERNLSLNAERAKAFEEREFRRIRVAEEKARLAADLCLRFEHALDDAQAASESASSSSLSAQAVASSILMLPLARLSVSRDCSDAGDLAKLAKDDAERAALIVDSIGDIMKTPSDANLAIVQGLVTTTRKLATSAALRLSYILTLADHDKKIRQTSSTLNAVFTEQHARAISLLSSRLYCVLIMSTRERARLEGKLLYHLKEFTRLRRDLNIKVISYKSNDSPASFTVNPFDSQSSSSTAASHASYTPSSASSSSATTPPSYIHLLHVLAQSPPPPRNSHHNEADFDTVATKVRVLLRAKHRHDRAEAKSASSGKRRASSSTTPLSSATVPPTLPSPGKILGGRGGGG